ncbi:MAG: cytochrome b/b6 domain-containing protein [Gammaproteobacteria bacterium]|nr:cytochrome b/b6 domain-containing protein [Gammaproteobacteria bacterium]
MNIKESSPPSELQAETVRVWDPLVRVFHWSLLGLFIVAWASGDEWKELHELAGYGIAGLLVLRVIWGFIGSPHARFADFIYRPTVVWSYAKDMLARRARRYIGHNPAGGVMVIALLTMLGIICLSGILMTSDALWGEEWIEEVHEAAVNVTLFLVGLHIAGVVFSGLSHGENLVRAMFTGRKRSV